eukprot:6180298-Pleurochrysis_carterae.AAC.1
MPGCSGSSFVARTAKSIVQLYSTLVFKRGEQDETEWLSPGKNPFFIDHGNNSTMAQAFKHLHEEAKKEQTLLLIKWNNALHEGPGSMRDKALSSALLQSSVLSIVGCRANVLDQLLCSLRDCFDLSAGYLVQANGSRSTDCDLYRAKPWHFGTFRRKQRATSGLIHLEPSQLIGELHSRMRFPVAARSRLQQANITVHRHAFHFEDLAAFQWAADDAAFNASYRSWKSFMRAWRIRTDARTKEYLASLRGSRAPPKRHSQLIQNYAEVRDLLFKHGLNKLLRS